MSEELENKVEPQSLSQPGNPEVQKEQAAATKSKPGPTPGAHKPSDDTSGTSELPDGI